jgi:hypothetical protein
MGLEVECGVWITDGEVRSGGAGALVHWGKA